VNRGVVTLRGGLERDFGRSGPVALQFLGVDVVALILAAEGDNGFFLGEDLLPYLVLAIGGALAVGNGLALIRPPRNAKPGELTRAPVGRSVGMLVVGLIAAIWALASLTSG